jgi:transcriptional regulator with XRE-family HTH domain
LSLIGERIKELRAGLISGHSLTQEELADKCGVSKATVINWEKGRRTPDTKKLLLLSVALNSTTGYLSGESDDPTNNKTDAGENINDLKEKLSVEIDAQVDVLRGLMADPEKFAAAKLLSELEPDQVRKVFDFIFDQKQLAELKRRMG